MTHTHAQHDDDAKQAILNNIDKYGCHLVLIESDNYVPGFVYSIGLFKKFNHPEIICFGLNTEMMASLLNHACDLIKTGKTFLAGESYQDFLEGFNIQFITVDKDHYADYLGYAGWFYDMSFDFPVLQLIWPDKDHFFPWENGFNPNWKYKQPLLDRNIDFKFYEERNLGVYTTRQAFEGDTILYVYHNEDGDWQFHTDIAPDINDAKIVCLEEITKLDPTINEVFRLQFGWRAWRENKESEWKFEEYIS